MSGNGSYPGKRAVDLAVVGLVALPCLVVGLACAMAVKLSSPGPVFFLQERVGLHGRLFLLWKFRTMVDRADNPVFPAADRITPAGRWLRRLSLDELPQLINIALGDMSVVGPRPALPYQIARLDERQRRRLLVRPGLTGLAQVRGRNSLPWAARIEMDLEYVERQSLLLDLGIVMSTAAVMLRAEGVGGHPADDPIARPDDDPRIQP